MFAEAASIPQPGVQLHNRAAKRTETSVDAAPPPDGPAAFEAMIRRQAARLLVSARRLLRDERAAQAAVHAAFTNALHGSRRVPPEAWQPEMLHRLLLEAALQRLPMEPLEGSPGIAELLPTYSDDGELAGCALHPWTGPSEMWKQSSETLELVRRCVDRLPDPYRTILLLCDVEELSTSEAAELLGIVERAAKSRLHQARQALRSLLEPHLDGRRAG
jgi:RNA polymerase sigma-70 factor (ECF subfamily)